MLLTFCFIISITKREEKIDQVLKIEPQFLDNKTTMFIDDVVYTKFMCQQNVQYNKMSNQMKPYISLNTL